MAEAFNLNKELIKPAKADEMKWKAKRPTDSSLNVIKAAAQLNTKPLELNQALETMKKEMRAPAFKCCCPQTRKSNNN